VLSRVEYFFLKPVWFSFKRRNSSEKVFNLLFNTDVNNFPKQLELSVLSESLQENLDFDNLNIHLNDSITRDEILTCIKKLKNDKASGDDMIRNEHKPCLN
jgi:hypothetical protein